MQNLNPAADRNDTLRMCFTFMVTFKLRRVCCHLRKFSLCFMMVRLSFVIEFGNSRVSVCLCVGVCVLPFVQSPDKRKR